MLNFAPLSIGAGFTRLDFNPGDRMSVSQPYDRTRILWILGLLALALFVRVAYWAEARHLSLVQVPTGDAATYVYLAE